MIVILLARIPETLAFTSRTRLLGNSRSPGRLKKARPSNAQDMSER
jgi:hypothetical protein